jgi:hypothetical protein
VAGRDRTCGASRFRRALYRAELRPHEGRQGWIRTSSLLFVRQALSQLSYSPTTVLAYGESSSPRAKTFGCADAFAVGFEVPGQGVEPRLPGSEPGVLPVRRSRIVGSCVCLVRMTRTMLSMPLAYASALDRAAVRLRSRDRSSYVEARWSPGSSRRFGNSACKSSGVLRSVFTTGRNGWELFSLRRGLESSYVFFKLGITSG